MWEASSQETLDDFSKVVTHSKLMSDLKLNSGVLAPMLIYFSHLCDKHLIKSNFGEKEFAVVCGLRRGQLVMAGLIAVGVCS